MEHTNENEKMYELLCKVVFGEATEAEAREVKAALEASAELREQEIQLRATVSLVRGVYAEGQVEDELSAEARGALASAARAASEQAASPILTGGPWHVSPVLRAAAAVTLIATAGYALVVALGADDVVEGEAATEVAHADRRAQPGSPHALNRAARHASSRELAKDVGAFYDDGEATLEEAEATLDAYVADMDVESLGQRLSDGGLADSLSVHGAQALVAEVQEPTPDPSAAYYVGRGGASSGQSVIDLEGLGARFDPNVVLNPTPGAGGGAGSPTLRYIAPDAPSGAPGAAGWVAGVGLPESKTPSSAFPGEATGEATVVGGSAALYSLAELGSVPEKKVRPGVDLPAAEAAPVNAPGAPPAANRGAGSRVVVDPGTESTATGGFDPGSVPSPEMGADDFFLGLGDASEPSRVPRSRFEFERRGWSFDRIQPTRLPNERPHDMFFRFYGDNPFVVSKQDALSTFAADVDTASFALARRTLESGYLPQREQIRTEEFVNFAAPDLAPPVEGTFALHAELAPSPFGGREDRWLLRVGVRAKEILPEDRPALALTFVVDTSGSMKENNRLELVKHALRLLLDQLEDRDTISIVAFSDDARNVLGPTQATARDTIETALFQLQPNGSTNAEAGLKLGYWTAETTLAEGVQTRVVFLSDGVANVGQTDQNRIADDVKRQSDRGIFLNTIGVGLGNHNDVFLEQLADRGQGVCDYVGDAKDARRAIVERFVGGFVTVAKDVKIQVEFAPGHVLRWRQLGYENRAVRDADFRNDAVDAGEIGAGHQVTCLYEVELASTDIAAADALATFRLRWKPVTAGESQPVEEAIETSRELRYGEIVASSFRAASEGFRRGALSAQLAECMRRSVHVRGDSVEALGKELAQLLSDAPSEDTATVASMTRLAIERGLVSLPGPRPEDVDAAHREAYYRALIRDLGGADPAPREGADAEPIQQAKYEQEIRDILKRDPERKAH